MFYVYAPEGQAPIYPFTLTDLRRLHTNVSWPVDIDAASAEEFGCYVVAPTDAPAATGKKAERVAPLKIDGQWVEQWALVDYSDQDIQSQWAVVRSERNKLLADCDWTQLPDASADAATWATYRQALRDITTQADPFSIVWPVAK